MHTRCLAVVACVLGLWCAASVAQAGAPVILAATPNPTSANTGASLTITGADFGSYADTVQFVGGPYTPVTPWYATANLIMVRVPYTWSGAIRLRSAATGLLSNTFDIDVSFNYTGTKWNAAAMPFTWYTHSSGAPGVGYTATHDALVQGYEAWECASGMTCSDGGSTTTLGNSQSDGKNVLWWSNLGSGGTIAVTNWVYNTVSKDIIEFDITFNTYYTWSVNGESNRMDIANIGTHEQGHSIGLGDMYGGDDVAKTMYGYSNNGDIAKRSLVADDVLGAEWMYAHAGRANLVPATPSGWYGSIVPRATNDANSSYAPLPAILPSTATTYVNCGLTNAGGDCASPFGVNDLWIDDAASWWNTWGGVWGVGYVDGWTNMGVTVRGGRHTLKYTIDDNNDIAESIEFDNTAQAQFVWEPYALTDQLAVVRDAPPALGSFSAPNCDGYKLTGNWWGVVGVIPLGSGEDFDVSLYSDYVNSTTGFTTPLVSSTYGGDASDFVGFNGNVAGFGLTRQVGVTRYTASPTAGMVVHESNQVGGTMYPAVTYNTSVTSGVVSVGARDILKVHEVYLGSTTTTYTFTLENLSGTADLDMGLYSATASYFRKSDYLAASTVSVGGGNETFAYKPAVTGYYGVVVWKKGRASDGLANTYQLRVGPTLANLCATVTPSGFSSAAVPRDSSNASYGHAVLTPVLHGNTNDTWVNWAIDQQGPNVVPAWTSKLLFDEDGPGWIHYYGADTPVGSQQVLNIGPQSVAGGRHSITVWADPDSAITETTEADNIWRGQWVWSPLSVALNTAVTRPAPPTRGAWVQPNTDGFQFARGGSVAWVSAVAPVVSGEDYDLYVYDDYANSTTGFSNIRGLSTSGGTYTDFVVGHYSNTPTTLYPGVLSYLKTPGGSFTLDQSDATGRNAGAPATILSQTLPNGRLADVYELYMTMGQTYTITVVRERGTAELATELFGAHAGGIYGRGHGLLTSSTVNVIEDRIALAAESTGWHPFVVYRNVGTETGDVVYSLYFQTGSVTATETPPALPATLDWRVVSANPVRGGVQCELRAPAALTARVRVFDSSGRCVRALPVVTVPAGIHAVRWDGTTDDGVRAGTGVYTLRLETPTARLSRRVTVLR